MVNSVSGGKLEWRSFQPPSHSAKLPRPVLAFRKRKQLLPTTAFCFVSHLYWMCSAAPEQHSMQSIADEVGCSGDWQICSMADALVAPCSLGSVCEPTFGTRVSVQGPSPFMRNAQR